MKPFGVGYLLYALGRLPMLQDSPPHSALASGAYSPLMLLLKPETRM
jgi:hypothetical protein